MFLKDSKAFTSSVLRLTAPGGVKMRRMGVTRSLLETRDEILWFSQEAVPKQEDESADETNHHLDGTTVD